MPTFNVKKLATAEGDIGGLKRSRYERLQVSYGTIEASSYDILDTLVFTDVPSFNVVRAVIVAHTSPSPVTLKVYPGTSVASPLTLTGLTAPAKISYLIEYIRGNGSVGIEGSAEFGEGERLSVVVGDISTLTTAQVAGLTVRQISELNTKQIADLTTSQAAALTTAQVEGLTTGQIGSLETADLTSFTTNQVQAIETVDIKALTTKQIAALKTTQIAALETVDVKALTSSQLKAMSTTQLEAFTTEQVAVLTTAQKSGLSAGQLAAL